MKKILVVDDEEHYRALLVFTLQKAGYFAEAVEDGEKGIVRARDWIPDLVISDVMMASAEVVEFAESIRKSGRRLQRLHENFLTYAQIELVAHDPKRSFALREGLLTDSAEIIRTVSRRVAELNGRTADLSVDVAEGKVAILEEYFTKIMEELIGNAFKFSTPGSPVVVRSSRLPDALGSPLEGKDFCDLPDAVRRQWNLNRHRRPFSDDRIKPHLPFVIFDDPRRYGEPEAGASPVAFGGEERIGDAQEIFRSDALSLVFDDNGGLAGAEVGERRNRQSLFRRRQCIAGVLQQIDDDLFESLMIAHHRKRGFGKFYGKRLGRFPNVVVHQGECGLHGFVQIHFSIRPAGIGTSIVLEIVDNTLNPSRAVRDAVYER